MKNLLTPKYIEVKLFNKELQAKLGIIEENSSLYQFPFKTEGALAFDLFAIIEEPIKLEATGKGAKIPTGISVQAWNDFFEFGLLLAIRSSLSSEGVYLKNSVGIADADYQGQILCSLGKTMNKSSWDTYTVMPGERIAQAMFTPKIQVKEGNIVSEFTKISERNSLGFGTTGKF